MFKQRSLFSLNLFLVFALLLSINPITTKAQQFPAKVNLANSTVPVHRVSAGSAHTCALTPSGGVKCWGSNGANQLGVDTTAGQSSPVEVTGLGSGYQSVEAGAYHTCALNMDGGVKCWGLNESGQLGRGITSFDEMPGDVLTLTGQVVSLAAGDDHTCALTDGGNVKCWGNNGSGQLGTGSTENQSTPIMVTAITGATAIAASGDHTCALLNNGAVKCWGGNWSGQVGNGTTQDQHTPVTVTGLNGGAIKAVALAAGQGHTCAVISDGGVKCWGNNYVGQLGDNSTIDRYTPVSVIGLTESVVAIDAGHTWTNTATCALTVSGGVKCWGDNQSGQLGDGTTTERHSPVGVTGLTSGVAEIAVGRAHACAMLDSAHGGYMKCWGDNQAGQLGDGRPLARPTPVDVQGLSGVTAIAASHHTCVLVSGGQVKCWGSNGSGELGNGTNVNSSTPTTVDGLNNITKIIVGQWHSCALTSSGGVKCWGANWSGQLGDSTTEDRYTPVDVTGLTGGTTTVTALAAGWGHTCALVADGKVKCWGDNEHGQLGNGTTIGFSSTPVEVSGLSDVVKLTAYGGGACAVTAAGNVKCWGPNLEEVTGLTAGVAALGASNSTGGHLCARMSNGKLNCWGDNPYGQLGDGTTTGTGPVEVSGVSNTLDVATGQQHTCAIPGSGGVKCWGANMWGQLGNSTTISSTVPIDVPGLNNGFAKIATGSHTCAVMDAAHGGGVKCWGRNNYGQLGDGIPLTRPTPVWVIGFGAGIADVSPGEGGSLVYTDTDGSVTSVVVPSGAVTQAVTLHYVSVAAASAPAGFAFAGHGFTLDAYQGDTLLTPFVFSKPVTITWHYTDADVAGVDEKSLVLNYWDDTAWKDAACGTYDRHPDENWLSVPVCHLSQFAFFGTPLRQVFLPLARH